MALLQLLRCPKPNLSRVPDHVGLMRLGIGATTAGLLWQLVTIMVEVEGGKDILGNKKIYHKICQEVTPILAVIPECFVFVIYMQGAVLYKFRRNPTRNTVEAVSAVHLFNGTQSGSVGQDMCDLVDYMLQSILQTIIRYGYDCRHSFEDLANAGFRPDPTTTGAGRRAQHATCWMIDDETELLDWMHNHQNI